MLIGGDAARELGDWSVDNYHGYIAFNFGDSESKARFYVLGGLGATHYGSVDFTAATATAATIGGQTPVLHHLGRRRQGVPRQERGPEARHALDADLHQVRRRPAGGATPTGAAT